MFDLTPGKTGKSEYSYWRDLFFLCIILGSLFFCLLGNRPLFVPDEGRYAEIAREMAESGNYVTPYLNHIKYFEKPILFYWLGSAAIKLGGVHLWLLRSINALIGLFGCILTYFTARTLFDRTTGLLSALILGTSTLYFVMANMISLDLPVTVFISASLYAFLLSSQSSSNSHKRYYLWGAAIAAALAVLTKGLIGLVFPLMVVGTWVVALREWRILKQPAIFSALLLFVLIAAPWHILVGLRNPEFFHFYFIEQHFLRYTTMEVGHYQPAWFFIPILIVGFFPWIVFLPLALKNVRWSSGKELFFLLWAGLIFIFFSFSKSKLIPYILPIFPALSILTAHYLAKAMANKKLTGIKAGYGLLLLLSVLFAFAVYFFIQQTALPAPKTAALFLAVAAFALLLGTLLSIRVVNTRPNQSIIITIASTWIFLMGLMAAFPSLDTRSIKPLADSLKTVLTPNDEVITFNQYFQDLPFYLEKRVSILNWKNELSFGMAHQDTHEWMLDDAAFWQKWQSHQRVFVIISKNEHQKLIKKHPDIHVYIVKETINNILISNQLVAVKPPS